jgi:hypothetical protein
MKAFFLKKHLKSAISSVRSPKKNKKFKLSLLTIRSCPRLLGKHVQKFQKSQPHRLWDYNIWSRKISFFPLCPAGTAEFDHLWCKYLELHNFEVLYHFNVILGTGIPNLRGRGTYPNAPCIEEGYKSFYYTSNSWGIFSEYIFSWDKNSNNW